MSDEIIRAAPGQLSKDGYCVLPDVLPVEIGRLLHEEFELGYARRIDELTAAESRVVGNRRHMISVALAGAFADPRLYANAAVLKVTQELLGADHILENFGVVASLPGAEEQRVHRDGSPLFESALVGMLPPHAITVVFPLIEMNNNHGTTALWPGTHRYRESDEAREPILPVVRPGSCVMWDYRLTHGGTPNRSSTVRPIIYFTYSRKWWRDADNFKIGAQDRLRLGPDFLSGVPEHARQLFAHL